MGIRDAELKRLENYGRSLGITITYDSKSQNSPDDGYFAVVSKKPLIHIFRNNHSSKIELIFTLLHEISHYLSWVYRGRKNTPTIDRALEAEADRSVTGVSVPKKLRKVIRDLEVGDLEYQDLIVKELNLKINKDLHEKQKQIDAWIFEFYYANGDFPGIDQIKNKKAEIYAKEKRKKLRRILSRKTKRSTKTNQATRKKLKKFK